jgi:L-fuculose-phosphate aldolase
VSARVGDGYLITPSGVAYERLQPRDVLHVPLGDTPDEATRPRPSSEWRIHRDIYRARPEAGAIVHAHPPFATALACLRRGIPSFHYMVAVAGGEDIRCSGYATYGTQELSDEVLAALAGRTACLMGNHGMVVFARTVDGALALAVEVETCAEQYWRALQVGAPVLLDKAEMARVVEKFKSYGTSAGSAPSLARRPPWR